jgi:hypothetical protein
MSQSVHAASALRALDIDDAVYDCIETLLAADLPQRDRSEMMRMLEDVVLLLSAQRSDCSESDRSKSDRSNSDRSKSEFPDPSARAFPMGQESSAH